MASIVTMQRTHIVISQDILPVPPVRAFATASLYRLSRVDAYMCTFFLVVAFRDARFLSGLTHRFSYIVQFTP